MAAVPGDVEELDDLTTCVVCFETFDTEKHMPRLLPCTHTLCEPCMVQYIVHRSITCTECRSIHTALAGVKGFPQNRYIIKHLESKAKQSNPKASERCEEHGREISLLCKEPGCEQGICYMCLQGKHSGHRISDIIQEKKIATEQISCALEHITRCKNKIELAMGQVASRSTLCVTKLQDKKAEIVEILDKQIQEVSQGQAAEKNRLDTLMRAVHSKVGILKGMKAELEAKNKFREIADVGKIVTGVLTGTKPLTEQKISYKFHTYRDDQNLARLTSQMRLIQKQENDIELPKQRIQSRFEITATLGSMLRFLTDNSVLVLNATEAVTRLTKYNGEGSVLQATEITPPGVHAVTEVQLHGKPCVALSYPHLSKIDFRNLEKLHEVVVSVSTGLRKPFSMCVSSPSTLLYEALSPSVSSPETDGKSTRAIMVRSPNGNGFIKRSPTAAVEGTSDPSTTEDGSNTEKGCRKFWSLDCSSAILTSTLIGEPENLSATRDLCHCYVEEYQTNFLIVVCCSGALFAYNLDEKRVEWEAPTDLRDMPENLQARAVATDGLGRLFVVDLENDCIQMFTTDGVYISGLKSPEFRRLRNVQWQGKSGALLIDYELHMKKYVGVLKVDM